MDEPSRRAYLGGLGVGLGGLLAGCAGRAPVVEPSSRNEETPSGTPEPSTPEQSPPEPEPPSLVDRLPAPAAVGGRYTFGAFDWDGLRAANLARGTLRPGRFVPGALQNVLPTTRRSLTINTGPAAGGTLAGDYDDGTVAAALTNAGFSRADGRFRNEMLAVAVDEDVVRWADAPDGGDAIIGAVGDRLDGRSEGYTDAAPALRPVLRATGAAPARFGRPLAVDSGPFETSTFLATGIGPDGGGVRWVSAVGFDGPVPTAARDRFRERYADLDEVEDVEAAADDGLLVVEVTTTADLVTSIQPL